MDSPGKFKNHVMSKYKHGFDQVAEAAYKKEQDRILKVCIETIPTVLTRLDFMVEFYTPTIMQYLAIPARKMKYVNDNSVLFVFKGKSPSMRGKVMFDKTIAATTKYIGLIQNYQVGKYGETIIYNGIAGKNVYIDVTGITAFSGLMGLVMSLQLFFMNKRGCPSVSLIIDKSTQEDQIVHSLKNEPDHNIKLIIV
jgi:hypothetical protein